MSNSQNEIFCVEAEEADIRLDQLLVKRYEGRYSRTYFQKLIEEGMVLINGAPVKKRTKPAIGDEIEVEFQLTPEISLLPEAIPLEILYEDNDLIVVNKPAGLVVHPAPGNWSGTFVNALLYHLKQAPPEGDLRPGIVHRLDKDTSGCLIAAKNSFAQRKLIESFASREIYKEYHAITIGSPGNRLIDEPIGRHPKNRQKMAVVEGGRQARSHTTVEGKNAEFSLVKVILETGRTHQIRVHLSHVGAPVLGDALYGRPQVNERCAVGRQLLHASAVRFPHPVSGKTVEVKAPLPKDFTIFLEQYRIIRLS